MSQNDDIYTEHIQHHIWELPDPYVTEIDVMNAEINVTGILKLSRGQGCLFWVFSIFFLSIILSPPMFVQILKKKHC